MSPRAGGALLALVLTARTGLAALLGAAAPAGALTLGFGFPIFVAMNPQRFGPERMASPVEGSTFGRAGRAAVVLDEPLPGGLDTRPTGAVAPPAEAEPPAGRRSSRERGARRPYRVLAVAGGTALIEHSGGAEMVRPGAVLPDGSRLLAVRADGTLDTAPADPAPMPPASPAQGDAPTMRLIERPALVRG